jgi:predicted DNA-binding ribbon-helix-helix protein
MAVRKRSITVNGHGTSYSIEDEFQFELVRLASVAGVPLAQLVAKVDANRPAGANLSSALRLHVLDALKKGL